MGGCPHQSATCARGGVRDPASSLAGPLGSSSSRSRHFRDSGVNGPRQRLEAAFLKPIAAPFSLGQVHHTTPVAVSGRRNSVASLSYSMLFGTSQGGCVGNRAVHVGCFVLSVPTQVVCRQFEPIVPPDSNVLDKAATTCSQSGGEILSDAGCIKRPRRHEKEDAKNSDIDSFGVSTNPIHIQRTACKHQSWDEIAAAMRLLQEKRCRGISQAA